MHFFKIQRAITPLLTAGVQCHLACIILLSIFIYSDQVSMKSAKALPRYGPGHKSAGRTDERKDGQGKNNIPSPMAGDNKQVLIYYVISLCVGPNEQLLIAI